MGAGPAATKGGLGLRGAGRSGMWAAQRCAPKRALARACDGSSCSPGPLGLRHTRLIWLRWRAECRGRVDGPLRDRALRAIPLRERNAYVPGSRPPWCPMPKPPPKSSGRGARDLTVKVKTAKGRTTSSTRWLERQLNDPYVKRAKAEGYRGRAAFKLMELDDRFRFLQPGARVVDLGSAPGGWAQVAVPRVNALGERKGARGSVLGLDLQDVDPVPGAEIHVLDFLADDADLQVKAWLGGPADVVMSDMAASASGHKQTDHLRIVALCEAAAELALDVLAPGGTFVAKVLAGGAEGALQARLKRAFREVHNVKPPASRADSSEKFVVALGFRGRPDGEPAGEPVWEPVGKPVGAPDAEDHLP